MCTYKHTENFGRLEEQSMGPQVEIVLEAYQIFSAQKRPISYFDVTLQFATAP